MDKGRILAAVIRAFYTFIFPLIGAGISWLLNDGNLESIGVNDGLLIVAFSAVLYGLKKYFFSATKF